MNKGMEQGFQVEIQCPSIRFIQYASNTSLLYRHDPIQFSNGTDLIYIYSNDS